MGASARQEESRKVYDAVEVLLGIVAGEILAREMVLEDRTVSRRYVRTAGSQPRETPAEAVRLDHGAPAPGEEGAG